MKFQSTLRHGGSSLGVLCYLALLMRIPSEYYSQEKELKESAICLLKSGLSLALTNIHIIPSTL